MKTNDGYPETIGIKEYLSRKGIAFKESGNELVAKCFFKDCDRDSRENEAHLYFSIETGQHDCKKCGSKGNIFTLAEHFGDSKNEILLNPPKPRTSQLSRRKLDHNLVEKCSSEMPPRIRTYLNQRGINDNLIREHLIGFGSFYGRYWITIPIRDEKGRISFLKLRRDPQDENNHDKGKVYPVGSLAELYGWETLAESNDFVVICEGEFDRLLLLSKDIPAVTSTGGAGTFKQEWLEKFAHLKKVYVCYDNDKAGRDGAERLLGMFERVERFGIKLFRISLPEEVGEGGDITDYFIKLNLDGGELLSKYASEYPEKKLIDVSKFYPLSTTELVEILGLTIKRDETNKLLTFLGELSAFTESSQINISYNAPSSTGKSYIPLEISSLFPRKSTIIVGYCSPTAFFHDHGKLEQEKNQYLVDLSRKILIFVDQPHSQLLSNLRPMLSHDQKEISVKITDKNQKGGNRTKNILLRGFPSVIFCTASTRIDEQEATRFLLLSPETNPEKIKGGINLLIQKEADYDKFEAWLKENPKRELLKERVEAIAQEEINEIKLPFAEETEEMFLKRHEYLKPKHQRDIKKIIYIAKSLALLNLWWREQNGKTLIASKEDLEEAFRIWDTIAESQELNLPPYIYNLYKEVILPLWTEKNGSTEDADALRGLYRKEIVTRHFKVYGRMLNDASLRQNIIPLLENNGLIRQEADSDDKRKMLSFLCVEEAKLGQNSEEGGGVKDSNSFEVEFDKI